VANWCNLFVYHRGILSVIGGVCQVIAPLSPQILTTMVKTNWI